jgi:hypothetical protein
VTKEWPAAICAVSSIREERVRLFVMPSDKPIATSRRELLKLIGLTAGSTALYQAMTSLG